MDHEISYEAIISIWGFENERIIERVGGKRRKKVEEGWSGGLPPLRLLGQ